MTTRLTIYTLQRSIDVRPTSMAILLHWACTPVIGDANEAWVQLQILVVHRLDCGSGSKECIDLHDARARTVSCRTPGSVMRALWMRRSSMSDSAANVSGSRRPDYKPFQQQRVKQQQRQ